MIDLLDPAALPKESLSNGPETWGEAWRQAAATTDETMRVIENTNADYDALERAYDLRIAEIRELTGQELANPMRVASDVDREMIDIFAAQAAGGGTVLPSQVSPDFRRRQEEEFNTRARALADRFPGIEAILAKPIAEQRNQVMRDAEANAGRAAQSPELGLFGRLTAQLAGGLKGAARDPAQWGMAMLGAGGSAAKTVAGRIGQTMLQEGLINGGQELLLQAMSQERKREAGLDHGLSDMLANAGIAATFGALFGGTVQGGAELARIFKLGEGGAERAARVIEGRPEPGDVEAVAKAMNVELGPEKLDLLTRSFEERVLDDVMVPADGDTAQLRVFEAAKRYADDPDNNPPPELIERLVADEEAARTRFSPDDYERMFAGDRNAIDDIADTFMADTIDDAARRIDAVADRVDAIAERVEAVADDVPAVREGGAPERTYSLQNDVIAERAYADGTEHIQLMKDGQHLSTAVVSRDGERVVVERMFSSDGMNSDGFNTVGASGMREFARLIAERYPDARTLEGVRVGGARHGGEYVGDYSLGSNAAIVLDRFRRRRGSVADPLQGQTIAPARPVEPLDDAAERIADVQAGEIVEPARDANGNPENFLDFVGVEDGDGNVKIMSTAEALAMADEPEFFADLLEACKL